MEQEQVGVQQGRGGRREKFKLVRQTNTPQSQVSITLYEQDLLKSRFFMSSESYIGDA